MASYGIDKTVSMLRSIHVPEQSECDTSSQLRPLGPMLLSDTFAGKRQGADYIDRYAFFISGFENWWKQ